MADDKQARIERLTRDPRLATGTELLKRLERHRLPSSVEEIESGRTSVALKQADLFTRETTPQDAPESTITPRTDI